VKNPAMIVLWSARILTGVVLCFWGFFIIAHLLGDDGAPSRPLAFSDYAILSMMAVSLLGLGVALKWERIGAPLALVGVAAGAVFNWRVLLFPTALIPLAAVLFVVYACLRLGSHCRGELGGE